MKSVVNNLASSLSPQDLLPSLSAAVVIWLLEVFIEISFAALIFAGELKPFLAVGIGTLLFGSMVFGIIVSLTSSFPCAIAMPQDSPGAIVAVVAASIVVLMPAATPERLLATVIASIILSTVLTGIGFWLMGHWKLGRLVRFMPYPVIGGFLAGTGWLLVVGGIGVMTDAALGVALLQPPVLLRWVPGLLFAIVLSFLLNRYAHFLLLPTLLVSGIGLFYLCYYLLNAAGSGVPPGTNVVRLASEQGWLLGPFPAGRLWQPVTLSALTNADWGVVAQNAVNMSTILLIGAISLLLNVTGLEIFMRTDTDLNQELKATGIANVVAGVGGSVVGYHALSFSALSHQLGVQSRLVGPITALLIGGTLFFSASLLSIFPKMVAGGFLIFLGLSFLIEWVYESWFKLPRLDYALIWLIIITIVLFGFLQGVAVGILVAVVLFAIDYSRINVVRHVLTGAQRRSRVLRPRLYEQLLQQRGDRIYILVLQGFLFFGSAHRLIEQIRTRIDSAEQPKPHFVILDFRLVTGVDSSALFAFSRLNQLAQSQAVELVVTHLSPEMQRLWQRDVLGTEAQAEHVDAPPLFADLDGGLAWCEEQIIAIFTDVGLVAKPKTFIQQVAELLPTAQAPTDWMEYLQPGAQPARAPAITHLEQTLRRVQVDAGECIVRQGQLDTGIYLLEAGRAVMQSEGEAGGARVLGILAEHAVIGEAELYAQQKAPVSVVASQPSTFLHLSAADLQAIEADMPELAVAIHRVLASTVSERLVRTGRLVEALQG